PGRDDENYLAHNRRGRGAELQAVMPCETDNEAQTFVEAAVAELQRVAEEKGAPLSIEGQGRGQSPNDRMELRYESGRCRGILEVYYYKGVRRKEVGWEYFIQFELDESYP